MLNIKALLCNCLVLDLLSPISLNTPCEEARIINAPMIITSSTRTTIEVGSTEVRATQTGAKSDLVNPTKIPPATNLTATIPCKTICWVVAFVPCPSAHTKNCCTPTRANWSNIVVKISKAWQGPVAVGESMRFKKPNCAHRAANNKNSTRTSLRPSCKIFGPWPL